MARMGAKEELLAEDAVRRTADIHVEAGPLTGVDVSGNVIPSLIDEIPVLAVAAALAEGTTRFADAGELRAKESDRVVTTVEMLAALGARAEPTAAGLVVTGNAGAPLVGGALSSHGDHRIAMAGAIGALVARSPVRIAGWEATATSYPSFEEDLRACLK